MPLRPCGNSRLPLAPAVEKPGEAMPPASTSDLVCGTLAELNRIGRYGYVQANLTAERYVFVIGQALSHVHSIDLQVGDELRFRIGSAGHADLLEVAAPADSFRSMRGGYLLRGESPPAREPMSQTEALAVRQADLAALPRIGTRKIENKDQLVVSLEGMAFALANFREELYLEGHPHWWQLADMLDDAMDILDAINRRGFELEAPISASITTDRG